jgi:hypothetical protein
VLNCLGTLYMAEYAKNAERTVRTEELSLVTLGGTDMCEIAVSGTVSKTAASNVVTGTGTAFTTELSVNGTIFIPGAETDPNKTTWR